MIVIKYLTRHDLDVFEKLSEKKLPSKLKGYLLSFYGKGGERDQVLSAQRLAARSCDGDCPSCCYCLPFCDAPLFDQILVILEASENGLFDPSFDNYESARMHLTHRQWAEEQAMVF